MKTIMRSLIAAGAILLLSACSGGGNNNNTAASCYGGAGGYQTYYNYQNPACMYGQGGYGAGGMNCAVQQCQPGFGWSCDKMACLAVAPCIGADRSGYPGAIPGIPYGLFPPTNNCWPLARVF